MRGFFPPSVDFVQESDLLSRFQDLCTVKHWRESELASCARRGGEESHWYREEEDVSRRFGKRDSGRNVCVHVCVSTFHWKLSLRRAWTWGVCPLKHLLFSFFHTGLISCHFLLAAVDPKWGRSIPSMWMGTKVWCFLFVRVSSFILCGKPHSFFDLALIYFFFEFLVTKCSLLGLTVPVVLDVCMKSKF